MALRVAVANGNWSNPAIWNAGVLPIAGDVVASNNFTVTIDQNINVDSLINTSQLSYGVVPKMTSNTTPEGIADQSSTYGAGDLAWRAFAQNLPSIGWRSNVTPSWISYQFVSPKVINSYFFINYGVNYGGNPKDWTFEGWNGTSWIVLHTVTNYPGNLTSYASPNIGNTTSYIKYRLNISLVFGGTVNTIISTLVFYEENDFPGYTTAGGGFILNSGVTTTLTSPTGGIVAGPTTCVTYSASTGTSTINGIVRGSLTTGSVYGINYSGAANLNINGAVTSGPTGNTNSFPIIKSGTGTLTIVGNVTAAVGTNAGTAIYNSGTGTINITGNVYGTDNSGYGHGIQNIANCTINITGNVYGGNINAGNSLGVFNSQSVSTINIVGNVYSSTINQGLYTNFAGYLSIIGSLVASNGQAAVFSGNSSAINIFSGPFICSPYGFFPYQVVRMHLIPTTNSYFEFRDETTNGAIQPGAIAPATQLVSPATLVDNLAVSDVRFGTTYALGTLTGTLRMPSANQVTFGIPVDNTFGNAVLTAASVWDYLISNITVENSIGMRLKNVSTPQSVGEQLEAFLRLD
jgi:hypothetical protein